jgi:hypothetical protein
MQLLKQSTASTVYVGPVLDSTGAAVTTAVVGDFRLIKNGTAATLSGATVTHDANGYYTIALTTSNTDTTGRLTIAVGNTAQSMATHRYSVLLASVYDALITNATNATGGLPTATGSISALAGAISTYSGGDTSGVTTLLTRLPSAISLNSGAVTVGTNNDKTGYSLTQAFPTNFSSLAIAAGTGAVTVGGDAFGNTLIISNLATQTTASAIQAKTDNLPAAPAAVSDIPTANQNRDAVLNAMPSAGYTNGSFGDRWLISTSDQREVAITGSNHIAADVHEFQAGVITAGDFAAGAIDANALAADAATEIATAVAATQALSRLDSMIESDGAGQFRFDTIALSMAPVGGGGGGGTDWTANERTAIRSILGFDSSGTVSLPTVGVMDAIKDKTDLITSDGISVLEDRVNESTITMQYNESTTASVNLDEDTTSATLQFVVSRPDGTDILTIANGSITRTASSFTVTITTAVTATLGQYLWSLRDITSGTNRVVTKGVLTVQNAASA